MSKELRLGDEVEVRRVNNGIPTAQELLGRMSREREELLRPVSAALHELAQALMNNFNATLKRVEFEGGHSRLHNADIAVSTGFVRMVGSGYCPSPAPEVEAKPEFVPTHEMWHPGERYRMQVRILERIGDDGERVFEDSDGCSFYELGNWKVRPLKPEHEPVVFRECDTCRAKPGSPQLCEGCRYNRKQICNLESVAREAWRMHGKENEKLEKANRLVCATLDRTTEELEAGLFSDGDPLICGCAGQVIADEGYAYISISDDPEDKCAPHAGCHA